MSKSQTYKNFLESYIAWASAQRFCEQCVRPWHDGICSCGLSGNEKVVTAGRMAMKLIEGGADLNDI